MNRKGFTLLEVLVAISILGIAIAVVLQLFAANLRAISASGDYVTATTRADAKLKEILNGDEKLSEKSSSEVTDDGYRVDVSVTEVLKERTETLPVKLLEVELTIRWARGAKERSLTMRTMKVAKREV